jgi:hypothetical protein
MIAMKSREFFVCVLPYRAIRKAYIIKDKKRIPINSKAPGKKRGWPGELKVLGKKDPSNLKAPGRKKECPGEGVSLLLGHSVIVRR